MTATRVSLRRPARAGRGHARFASARSDRDGGPVRRLRWQIMFALGLLFPLVILAVTAALASRPSSPRPSAAELLGALDRYEQAVKSLSDEAASVVHYGMKPGVADIQSNRYPDDVLVRMAQDWATSMQRIEQDFARLAAPPFLAAAGAKYNEAARLYSATAEGLLSAARASGAERQRLVTAAADLGDRADRAYGAATAAMKAARTDLEARRSKEKP